MKSLLLLVALSLMTGCATIQPGHDPVVVNAERTVAVAADAFDSFLKVEYETRPALQAVSPAIYHEIHRYAQYLRQPMDDGSRTPRAKAWLKSARRLTAVYKANRTPENRANLETVLATLTAAMAETRSYLARSAALNP